MNYKASIYENYRNSFKGTGDKASLEFGAAKLLPVLKPWVSQLSKDAVFADLGCGAGELLLALRQLGFSNLSGCDLSEEQIELAKQIAPNVSVANLFDFLNETPENSIDVITVFDVIEHLTKQELSDFLALAFGRLTKGGMLIGHTPNGLSPFVGHVYFGDPTHEWCPSPNTVEIFTKVAGFQKFEAHPHFGASNSLSGRAREFLWNRIAGCLNLINTIETGSRRKIIWTRNFAFMAMK